MKKLMTAIVLFCAPMMLHAATDGIHLQDPGNDIQNKESLRNGAKTYMEHCAACHAGKYMRFERIAQDLELSEEQTTELMRFGVEKASDPIKALIEPMAGEELFGVAPPDLTLEAAYRGEKWLYTYLMTFVKDDSRLFGYNNEVMKNVAMPWVMASYQESMSEEDFANQMRDLTNFMVYMAEPIKPFRESFGKYIFIFLFILLIPVWLLKNEYWKDIH